MPSPFPGMDPYLEGPTYWSGFHTRFIVAIGDAIAEQLPPGYYAEVELHVWLEDETAMTAIRSPSRTPTSPMTAEGARPLPPTRRNRRRPCPRWR